MAGGRTDGLIKAFRAGAALVRFRIVKFGAADDTVVQAAASTDASIGVTIELDAPIGRQVDVAMSDITPVEYGGNVGRGDWLTSDALGRAITAAPAAGANAQVIGRAMVSGVLGDIGSVHLRQGAIQG